MTEPADHGDTVPHTMPHLAMGEALEQWARTASQADRNAVHNALFAMVDGSLFRTYRIVEDVQLANELYVIVKDDLVLKLRINRLGSFDVIGVGPRDHFAAPEDGGATP